MLRRFLEEKSPPQRRAPADGNRRRLGAGRLGRAEPAARPDRACTSPKPMAARASASSNSASCWRKWAAPCSAPRISPPTVLAATAILNAGTEAQKQALLPADRRRRNGRHPGLHRSQRTLGRRGHRRRRRRRRRRRVTGSTASRASCSTAIPPTSSSSLARAPGLDGRRRAVVLHGRAATHPGLTRRALKTMDPTRKLARLTFNGVEADAAGRARRRRRAASRRTHDQAAVCLANEMVGGAERLRDDRRWTTPICACSSAGRSPRSSR